MNKTILKCDLHDYLEIACLFHIEVELMLKDGTRHIGVPVTTIVTKDKGEALEFRANLGRRPLLLPLLSLKTMRAIKANPHFENLVFNNE